jgi:hypothetical protein
VGDGATRMPEDQFDPGLIPFGGVQDAQADRSYVDSGIILDELTDTAPWFFSVLYEDGGAISIPLELMFLRGSRVRPRPYSAATSRAGGSFRAGYRKTILAFGVPTLAICHGRT